MKKVLVALFMVLVLMASMSLMVFATEIETTEETETFDFFEWAKETFTVEKVVAFLSAIASAFMTAIVTRIMKRIDKDKEINTTRINEAIQKGIQEALLKDEYQEYNKHIVDKINKVENGFGKIIKAIALMQDGTPQSKLAMYDLIESTGIVDKSTIEICKADVQAQIEKTETETKGKLEELDKIIMPVE
jgi:hypothetical protein